MIATGGKSNRSVYFVDNFDALDGIAGQLQAVILNFALEGKRYAIVVISTKSIHNNRCSMIKLKAISKSVYRAADKWLH